MCQRAGIESLRLVRWFYLEMEFFNEIQHRMVGIEVIQKAVRGGLIFEGISDAFLFFYFPFSDWDEPSLLFVVWGLFLEGDYSKENSLEI